MAAHTFRFYLGFNLFLLLIVINLVLGNNYQDILGCGGFIKSAVAIDFSKIEIKLYTKQRTQKESSDCAPTNGYYFLPVYDRGEYILKVQPPKGWHFEPEEIPISFDGVNDPCSKGQDINFQFKGFTVEGKVNSAGSQDGPNRILVTIVSEKDKSLKLTTYTGEGGNYRFAPLLSGRYMITASKGKYKFSKDSVSVVVENDYLQVPLDSLVVAGYDVSGHVFYNGEPTVGVNFVLSAIDQKNRNINVEDCLKTLLVNFKHKDFVCHVLSKERGMFLFKTIPPGKYVIRPHYAKFDVQPKEMNVFVNHDHLHLSDKFLVKGFIVNGRVLNCVGGQGLNNAEVYLNNEKVTVTDREGKYMLDSMEPGNYVLSVRSENFKFDDVTVKLSPETPEIPSIVPAEFKVCGLVTSSSGHESRTVIFQPLNDEHASMETAADRETGKFCRFLRPGHYNLAVKLTDSEKSSGTQYLPLVREVHVKNSPISDIEFTQLRGTIRGKVVKLPEATRAVELSVKLKLKDVIVALKILEGNSLGYEFDDVMPGTYDVEVENVQWCFENEIHTVSLLTANTLVPDFKQTGFKVQIKSSHDTDAIVTSITNDPTGKPFSKKVKLKTGANSICLPQTTTYRLIPTGCHGYENDSYVIDTKQGHPLNLEAVSHDVTGYINCPNLETNLMVDVIQLSGQTTSLGPLREAKSSGNGSYTYKFSYRAKENQILKFTPVSDKLIFQPDSYEHRMKNDCSEDVATFTGEKGLILEGGIHPPLNNVKVTLKMKESQEGREGDLTVLTKSDGKYKFGPLRNALNFEIVAEKESYVFSGPDKKGVFRAHKLAEINVRVIDNATNDPLQGVLLSLTGGEKYRKNSMTDESGSLTFHSLSPGEYFLRPMMKEYKFQPPSQIIQIKEGMTENIELRGRRVSFSAYGSVISLNGEPEANVLVEAVGIDSCSNLVEEAFTEASGQFRIRGLLPQCEYQLKLKMGAEMNAPIHRLEPRDLYVKTDLGDVRDVQLFAFYLMHQMDLSVHVESTIPEHLKTIKLNLYKENQPDSPIHAIKLDTLAGGAKQWGNEASQERFLQAGILVQFPFIPRDNATYFIQLESSLSRNTYSFREPTVQFVADKTFRTFKIVFEPVLKTIDHELSQSNYIVVPFLILAALFYVYFNKAVPFLLVVLGSLNQASFSFAREERNYYLQNNGMDGVEIEPVLVTTKRKVKPRKA